MNPYVEEISSQLAEATGLSPEALAGMIETPPDPQMGDYALPCFSLAKALRKAPNRIAEELKALVKTGGRIAEARPAGPYLNFFVTKGAFVEETLREVVTRGADYGRSDEGRGKTVTIDFSSPNISKPFTIAHLRTTAIGHSLCRLYEALGWRAVGINYLGDWGAPHGMNLAAYERWGDEQTVRKDPVHELFNLYVRFNSEVEKDPSLKEAAQGWTRRLEQGDDVALTRWRWFRSETIEDFRRIYARMGVTFTVYSGESVYHRPSQDLIEELKARGLARESEGALVVPFEDDDMPPGILQTSHGTIVYLPRDLAAAVDRKKTYDFDRMIYVVGAEQSLHFKQLFRTLKMIGHDWADTCVHATLGMITFKGIKMSSRKGNVIFLEDVLDRAVEEVRAIITQKNPDLIAKDDVARAVGIGAVIYADVSARKSRDVVFDWAEILNFNGETGPYVQYTHARYCSVLRKLGSPVPSHDADLSLLREPEAVEVAKCLAQFPGKVRQAAEACEPSVVATYLIDLCTVANRFYNAHRVIGEAEAVSKARAALVYGITVVLRNGLYVLGMEAPEEM